MLLATGWLFLVAVAPAFGSSSFEDPFELTRSFRICGSRMADILEQICANYGGIAKRADAQLILNGSPESPYSIGSNNWAPFPLLVSDSPRPRRRDSLMETCRINPEDKLLCQCCPKYNNNNGCTTIQLMSFCASKTKQPRKW